MPWNFMLCETLWKDESFTCSYYLVFKQARTSCGSVQMFLKKMVQLSN